MQRPTEIQMGAALAVGAVAICALLGTPLARAIPDPSSDLLEAMATIGTGLLLAYVIEMAWLVTRVKDESDYEKRLGVYVGWGVAGLLGIVISLLLAAHQAAGHSNLLDDIGVSWAAFSLAILGLVVTLHPLLVHEWSQASKPADG